MSLFPENEVEILRSYLPGNPEDANAAQTILESIRNNILQVTLPEASFESPGAFQLAGFPLSADEERQLNSARSINTARKVLLAFLFDLLRRPEGGLRSLTQEIQFVYSHFKSRDFARLHGVPPDAGEIGNLEEQLNNTVVATSTPRISTALSAQDTTFPGILELEIDDFRPPEKTKITLSLRGYGGPNLDSLDIDGLIDLHALIVGGAERDFRLGLLRAESHIGSAGASNSIADSIEDHRLAIDEYAKLLPHARVRTLNISVFHALPSLGTAGDPPVHDTFMDPRPLTTRQKFVAIRSGFAHLSLGDTLFRSTFRPDESERAEIKTAYEGAIRLMQTSGISSQNTLRQQIVDYAEQQLDKLKSGLNFLGYRDSHVPTLTLSRLENLAKRRIEAAKETSGKFQDFKTRGDALTEELLELGVEDLNAELGVIIAEGNAAIADSKRRAATDLIAHIDEKESLLDIGLAADLTKSIFFTAGLGGADAGGATFDGPGLTTTFAGYLAGRNELQHQRRAAQIGQRIADKEMTIANLEKLIADNRLALVKDLITAKKFGKFNANRFFALANAYEDMARRHINVALALLYQFERVIEFRRLKTPSQNWPIVEPAVAREDVLLAPATLDEILIKLHEQGLNDGPGQNSFTLPPWSVATQHPIEFSQFLQTGSMEFVISLYDVENLMGQHGHSNVRVKRIDVEVVPPPPVTGFVGHLIHRGVTLLRHEDLTLDPPSTRLVPTDSQLDEAIAELESGKQDRVAAEGVVLLTLSEGRLLISSEPQVEILDPDKDFDLLPIENYGLPGIWRLEIENMDLRRITDVRLRFTLSTPQQSGPLDTHVQQLIEAYETELADNNALDRIATIKLRQHFPNTFFQLEQGQGSFELRDQDFPPNLTDLKVKAIVAQTIDQDGLGVLGVTIEIAKSGTAFIQTQTTVTGGFSVDVNTDIPEVPESDRPSIQGTWQVRLPNPGQFALLDDMRMFFIYTFEPKPV